MIDIKTSAIRELVAPVVAFLRHDIARPDSPVLDLEWAEGRLAEVLKILNDTHAPVVSIEETSSAELRQLVHESFNRRD